MMYVSGKMMMCHVSCCDDGDDDVCEVCFCDDNDVDVCFYDDVDDYV